MTPTETKSIDKIEDILIQNIIRNDVTVEYLEFVSTIPIDAVKFELAINSKVPEHIYIKLYEENNISALMGLASNPDIPKYIFEKICETDEPIILECLARNNITPIDILLKAYRINLDKFCQADVAQNLINKSVEDKQEYVNNLSINIKLEKDEQVKYNLLKDLKLFNELMITYKDFDESSIEKDNFF
jgi:hypothetical protein